MEKNTKKAMPVIDTPLADGVKAMLFDLDGVVFDTEPQYSRFWGEQFRKYHDGHSELADSIKGQTLVQIYDKYFSGERESLRPVITESLDRYEQDMEFPYIAGFEDFISEVNRRNIKTAVVTSSNLPKMHNVYGKHPGFQSLFDAILTSEDFALSKPDPDCYLKAAERLGCGIDECLVFEDSFNGLRAGRAAGMKVVGLSTTNPAEAIAPLCNTVIPDYKQ